MIGYGGDLVQTYGTRPADGEVLAPLAVRLAWGISVSLMGISFPVVMWLYAECYVSRVEFDEPTKILSVHTLQLFGSKKHEIYAPRILRSSYYPGKLKDAIGGLDTPFWIVQVKDRKLPLVVDGYGNFIEKDLMHRYFRLSELSYL